MKNLSEDKAKKVLTEITGIPEYRMDDDRGEFVTKSAALKAMEIHSKNQTIEVLEELIKEQYLSWSIGMKNKIQELKKQLEATKNNRKH